MRNSTQASFLGSAEGGLFLPATPISFPPGQSSSWACDVGQLSWGEGDLHPVQSGSNPLFSRLQTGQPPSSQRDV